MPRGDDLLTSAERRLASWLEEGAGADLEPQAFVKMAVLIVVDALNGESVCVLTPTGWSLEHDLRCRLGRRKDCVVEVPLRAWLKSTGRPPLPPGRYRVDLNGKSRGQESAIVLERE